jgi:hypothetical protein
MSGVDRELFVYLMTDDEGTTGVAYMETAGAAKISLIAEDAKGARLLKPIAQKLSQIVEKPITLVRFSNREDLEVLEP